MDTKLKAEAKNYFFNLISKAVFGKILENIRKQKDIKLVTANQKEMVQYPNLIIVPKNGFHKIYQQQK